MRSAAGQSSGESRRQAKSARPLETEVTATSKPRLGAAPARASATPARVRVACGSSGAGSRDPCVVMESLALAPLFRCEVAVAQAVPTLVDGLYADELEYVARAVDKRRAEFGTARACARRALAQLGIEPCSLVPHADRSPRWPEGVVGSISHTDGHCGVVVALSSHASGLGLDIERDGALHADLEAVVCTPAERRWLAQCGGDRRGHLAKLVFSAKEAFYKCQYPTTRTFLAFDEVELRVDLETSSFSIARVRRRGETWRALERAAGRLLRAPGFIVTAVTL
jgi:4'-phosphopantetheinyl transferase EntD